MFDLSRVVQRSEIRDTYGIEGSCEKDCATILCCNFCDQFQIDLKVKESFGQCRGVAVVQA